MRFTHIRSTCGVLIAWAMLAAAPGRAVATVGLRWADIGDANNPASGLNGLGSVPYPYRISQDEVTNAQYAQFLSTKATVGDLLKLYNASMGTNPVGGISRTGARTAADPHALSAQPKKGPNPGE